MARVHTVFDCKHEKDIDVDIDADVQVPDQVRGLGKCPECAGQQDPIAISGVAPGPGGKTLVLDSILMIAL